ncbi:hypothetical protein EBT11_02450 [bacterium]|nr:hypothetical protein [bacterium]
MNFLRGIALLMAGCVVGVLLAPRLAKVEGAFGGLLEKGKERARPASLAKETGAPARPAAVPAPQPVRSLKAAEAAEIGRFMGISDEATPGKISKALEQSGGRWAVADARKTASPERPWVAELLPGPVAYWRIRSLGVAVSEAMGRDWLAWKQKNPLGAVLDLRECLPGQSLEAVAELAGLFVTPGEVLFTWRDGAGKEKVFRSDRQPLGLGSGYPLIVLIGSELRGAGELLAYLLQERGGAILIGQSTAGQMGWLAETRLSSGRSLFRMQGEILLPGGQAPLGRPLPPDLNLAGESLPDTEIWPGGEATIASTVTEVPPIKRPNEAALLQEDDVEMEEMRSGAAAKDEMKRPSQDKGLQRAGDLLRGLRKLPTARRSSI